jgi:hypothetical protein
MTTIADVNVNREMYPSSSTGGWGEQFVADGTRGGYIWKVRFLRNTGTYAGMTFPPGAGNADALALNTAGMSGDGMDVTVKVIQEGSTPMSGEFTVGLLGKTSKSLAHNIDNIVLKQEIEDINAVGGVSCTREDRTGLKLSDNRPGGNGLNAIATVARDSEVATISNADLRRYLTEGDVIRIGGADVTAGKIGSNGDVPVSVDGVSTQPGSPIFPTVGDLGGQLSANPGLGATVVADQQLRLDVTCTTSRGPGLKSKHSRSLKRVDLRLPLALLAPITNFGSCTMVQKQQPPARASTKLRVACRTR